MNYQSLYSQDCFDHAIKTNQLDHDKTYMYMGSQWDLPSYSNENTKITHYFKDKMTRRYTYVYDNWNNWVDSEGLVRHKSGKDSNELAMSRIESRIY